MSGPGPYSDDRPAPETGMERRWRELGREEGRQESTHDAHMLIDALIGSRLDDRRRFNIALILGMLAAFSVGLGIGLSL